MEIGQVEDLEALATRFLASREWIRLWFCEPATEVQRRCWREWTRTNKVVADELREVLAVCYMLDEILINPLVHHSLSHLHWQEPVLSHFQEQAGQNSCYNLSSFVKRYTTRQLPQDLLQVQQARPF